jgi:hypothetical protein
VPPAGIRERSLVVDYLDDAPESNLDRTLVPEPLEAAPATGGGDALTLVNPAAQVDAGAAAPAAVDPLLAELLTDDRNLRRRVVGALLRAVLTDRRIT